MNFIEEIKKPIANAFSEFEEQFLMALHTENPLLKKVTDFVVQTRGKQMRPILVIGSDKWIYKTRNNIFCRFFRNIACGKPYP